MTVNTPPFEPILRIYPGADPMDASTWGVGEDISAYIRHPGTDGGQSITYKAGKPDGAASADPADMSLTLDNRDGRFSTRNPNGPYYGDLRRGTPISLSMMSGEDDFSRTAAGGLGTSSGGGAWTSTSAWSSSGGTATWAASSANMASTPSLAGAGAVNTRARITVWPTVVAAGSGALFYGVVLRRVDASNGVVCSVEFQAPAGAVVAKVWNMTGGTLSQLGTVTIAASYAANDKYRVVCEADGATLRLKTWKPANPATPDADEPDAWSLTVTSSRITGAGFGLYPWRLSGNTNPGSVNFTWSDLEVEAVEFTGSVVSWPVRWNKVGTNCWAPIKAAGILRRINQAGVELRSPIYRQLIAEPLTAYWPLEDQSGATSYAAATPGTPAGTGINFSPAQESSLPGASVAPVATDAAASLRFTSRTGQTGTGFAALWLTKWPTASPATSVFATLNCSGRITTWEFAMISATTLRMRGYESDGTLTVDLLGDFAATPIDLDDWVVWQLETSMVAGTVTWDLIFHRVGEGITFRTFGSTYSSSVSPRCYGGTLGGTNLDGIAFSHFWLGENTLPFVTYEFVAVADGFQGETAAERVARLCDEEGIPAFVHSGDSEAMGRQRAAIFLDLLKECAETDHGILYEAGNGIGYIPRGARYDHSVDMALTVASGEIAEPPEPEDDDQRVTNDVTVSRVDGSSARMTDTAHIAVEGRWPSSQSINPETDDVLPAHAGWALYLGTRDDMRWPGLDLNLARSTSLIPSWRGLGIGSRITVDTGLSQVETADPDVFLESYEATLWPAGWTITMNCSSAVPWDVGSLDSGIRIDTGGSELASAVTTTGQTSWSVATTSGPLWMTTATHPAEFPFTIQCGGEVVTVTAITGTSSPQTFTVTRSTNGIQKTHAAGADVRLAEPTYIAL